MMKYEDYYKLDKVGGIGLVHVKIAIVIFQVWKFLPTMSKKISGILSIFSFFKQRNSSEVSQLLSLIPLLINYHTDWVMQL